MICAVFHFCCFFFARRGFRLSLVIVSLFVLVILEALLKCPLTKYLEKKKKNNNNNTRHPNINIRSVTRRHQENLCVDSTAVNLMYLTPSLTLSLPYPYS